MTGNGSASIEIPDLRLTERPIRRSRAAIGHGVTNLNLRVAGAGAVLSCCKGGPACNGAPRSRRSRRTPTRRCRNEQRTRRHEEVTLSRVGLVTITPSWTACATDAIQSAWSAPASHGANKSPAQSLKDGNWIAAPFVRWSSCANSGWRIAYKLEQW
jgi:hypothetical protein